MKVLFSSIEDIVLFEIEIVAFRRAKIIIFFRNRASCCHFMMPGGKNTYNPVSPAAAGAATDRCGSAAAGGVPPWAGSRK